jgi:RNA polymerase primary sigma factor
MSPRDSIQAYLNEIGRYPLLTKAQEVVLGTQVQAWLSIEEKDESLYSDEEKRIARVGKRAKAKFINCNLRLVVNIARKYVRQCKTLDFMDLIQEGNLGLMRAVEKFDPTRGYAMSTYAYWWIRQSIQRAMQATDHCIRLPIGMHDAILKINRTIERMSKELGRDPTIEEVAEDAGMNPEEVKTAIGVPKITISLDKVTGVDEGSLLIDIIADSRNSNTIEDAEIRINTEEIYLAIDKYLDNQTKFIILERTKDPPTSWRELASSMKMSKARLQAMEQDGIKRCAMILSIKNRMSM